MSTAVIERSMDEVVQVRSEDEEPASVGASIRITDEFQDAPRQRNSKRRGPGNRATRQARKNAQPPKPLETPIPAPEPAAAAQDEQPAESAPRQRRQQRQRRPEEIDSRLKGLVELRQGILDGYQHLLNEALVALKDDRPAIHLIEKTVPKCFEHFTEDRGIEPWLALDIIDRTLARLLSAFNQNAETWLAEREQRIEQLREQWQNISSDELLMSALFGVTKRRLQDPLDDLLEGGVSLKVLVKDVQEAQAVRDRLDKFETDRQKLVERLSRDEQLRLLFPVLPDWQRKAVEQTVEVSLGEGVPLHLLEKNLQYARGGLERRSNPKPFVSPVNRSTRRHGKTAGQLEREGQEKAKRAKLPARSKDNSGKGGKRN